jgi:hypothetical protein
MPSTYSGNPALNNKDELRFYVGDTDMEDAILSDEEIYFILSTEKSFDRSVIVALERIVHRLANEVSTALGPSRIEAQQRYNHYRELHRQIRGQFDLQRVGVFAGGININQKRRAQQDKNRTAPFFTRE